MRTWRIVCVITAAVIAVIGSIEAQSQSSATGASKPAKSGADQVQRIVLPKYPAEIPAGPNVQVYEKDCLTCHTARYVSMQPRFSKTVWQNEVKKMVDAYGAAIPEADQALIVEYLVAVKGVEAPATTSPPPK
jgi:cytochrome c5